MKRIRALTAALAAVCALSGCRPDNGLKTQTYTEIVNFKAITLGPEPETGMDELYEQLDALTIPELGCTLRFEFIPWGDEREQLDIATASGEYDFIPGGVFSNYRDLVSRNAFLNLNDYLELTPGLFEHYQYYSADALKQCEIDGGLYGLPQFGSGEVISICEGFFFREDLRKKWGLPEITGMESMEAYLYRAKQEAQYRDQPLITDNRIWQSLWLLLTKGKYLEVRSMMETPFVVVEAAHPEKVINRLETPEFAQVLDYIRKWRRDGILEENLLAASDNEGEKGKQLILNDRKPCETNVPLWSVNSKYIPSLTEVHPDWEYGFFPYMSGNEDFYGGSLASSSVISISAKTTKPETAMRLLEKFHTDQRYYDLAAYGVEGIHYRMQDGRISYEGIPADCRFTWTACTDTEMAYEDVGINKGWDEKVYLKVCGWVNEVEKKAQLHPLADFSFSTKGLERELEELEDVKRRYFQPLVCGYGENSEEELSKTLQELEQAGLERYREALQNQIKTVLEK